MKRSNHIYDACVKLAILFKNYEMPDLAAVVRMLCIY